MTVADKNWLIGRTDTQALYGDRVEVLKESGNWVYIAVADQFNTDQAKGYEGWVPKTHVKAYTPVENDRGNCNCDGKDRIDVQRTETP